MTSLREIARSQAFELVRDFEDAARFHVWHTRLGIGRQVDDAVVDALSRGRGYALVGPTGSGKTSTLAAAALGADDHSARHVPVRLSVSGAAAANAFGDPRFFAARLVRDISRMSAAVEADAAAASGTATGPAATWRATLGPRTSQVAGEIKGRTEAVTFERSPNEVMDVAVAAVEDLLRNGLKPVVLLEDADGLLRTPGRDQAQRMQEANACFADGLYPLLSQLDAPALVAAQPEYLELDGFARIRLLVDDVGQAPGPEDCTSHGIELLIGEALRTARAGRQTTELFSPEALATLRSNRWSLPTFRHLIEICDRAVKHARDERLDVVGEPSVGYAITQVMNRR